MLKAAVAYGNSRNALLVGVPARLRHGVPQCLPPRPQRARPLHFDDEIFRKVLTEHDIGEFDLIGDVSFRPVEDFREQILDDRFRNSLAFIAVAKTVFAHRAKTRPLTRYSFGAVAIRRKVPVPLRRYSASGELYAHAAAALFPDSLADLREAYADSLRKSNEGPPLGYSAQSCEPLSDTDIDTVRDLATP